MLLIVSLHVIDKLYQLLIIINLTRNSLDITLNCTGDLLCHHHLLLTPFVPRMLGVKCDTANDSK